MFSTAAFRSTLLSLVFAFPVVLAAQRNTADSLITLLRAHPRADTVRADLLNALAEELEDPRPDTAIIVAREALGIARVLRDPARQVRIIRNVTDLLFASFDSAYYYLRMGVPLAREAGDARLLGHLYDDLSYTHLSRTFVDLNQARGEMLERSVAYSDSAIQSFLSVGDTVAAAYSLARKGETLTVLLRNTEALSCLHQGLRYVQGTASSGSLALHASLGQYYDYEHRPDSALHYYRICLRMSEELGKWHHFAYHQTTIAQQLAELGRYDQALQMASDALAFAQRMGYAKEGRDAIYSLYRVNQTAGRMGEALKWHEQLLNIMDSTNAVMAQESMNKLQVELESVKNRERVTVLEKDQQINEQKRARQRMGLFALGGGTLLVIVLALVVQNRYRLKRKALKESEEQKAIIAKEHARSEELLLNILPEEVAQELKAKGSAEAVQIDQVTVLFTDFKGFTAMSEKVTPKALVYDLNECFSTFDRITEKYGIEKIKTIGDAYMAAGGLPTPNRTHATDVINAALEMRDFIAESKARKVATGLPYFEIRIGIHTGPVVAGIVGVKKFQYDIWGDTVNIASRMESSGEVGQVNISEATYVMVKNAVVNSQLSVVSRGDGDAGQPATDNRQQFSFTPRGKVQAKGKGEMEMWFAHRAFPGDPTHPMIR